MRMRKRERGEEKKIERKRWREKKQYIELREVSHEKMY